MGNRNILLIRNRIIEKYIDNETSKQYLNNNSTRAEDENQDFVQKFDVWVS